VFLVCFGIGIALFLLLFFILKKGHGDDQTIPIDPTDLITNIVTEAYLDSTNSITFLETEKYIDSSIPSNLETEKYIDSSIPSNLETETYIDSSIPSNLETEIYIDSSIPSNLETETYIYSTQVPITINFNDNTNIEEKEFLEDQCILIDSNLIKIYHKWDYDPGNTYDLDLWLEEIDENNSLIEKVYYDNKDGFNEAVNLNEDNTQGYQYNNITEIISINLTKIQYNIKSLIVLIDSYHNNDILNASNAFISLYEISSNSQKLINNF